MIRFSLICLFLTIGFVVGQDQDNLVNTNVDRTLDLVSHLPKETISVTIENRGNKATRNYDYLVESQVGNNVAFVGAVVKGKDNDDQASLTIKKQPADKTKGTIYRIELPNELRAGQTITLEIEVVYVNALRMYPAEITQGEKQLVLYKTNTYYYSRYPTTTQKTVITLPTDRTESYSQTPKPVVKSEQSITYGPYENIAASTNNELSLHYENNNPFLTVSNLKRWIEISHWGNIAVEETVDIYHSGAKLKGSFSRLDFQRRQDSFSAVKTFKTSLPASARDVYYRDEIGNVSTSHVREMQDQVEVEIRPRFPLYGGWKTHYMLGYNVPSYQYLYNKGNQYVLKMRLIDHIYDEQLLEQVTVKIVLPEHARNIEFVAPSYDVQRLADEKQYTYLDTVGRPVVVLTKRNMLFQHIQDFEIHYTFDKIMLFHEPMLIVIPLFGLFCLVILLVRLNFSITHNESNETRLRIQAIWDQITENNIKRTGFYQKLEEALNSYKTNKDLKAYNEQRKKVENDLKTLQQDLTQLQTKLRTDSADAAEKINELQRLDGQQREAQLLLSGHAEKLVNGRIQKDAYLEQEKLVRNKFRDINTRITSILNHY